MIITSLSNPRIKQIKKLQDKKERQRTGLFYLEGLRIIGEAFQRNVPLELLISSPDLITAEFAQELIAKANQQDIEILEVSSQVFRKLALKENPQGLAAVARQTWQELNDLNSEQKGVWIALDAVQDPGNLGTIMRTADAASALGIILLDHSTDPFDPSAVRASMGSLFSIQLMKTQFDQFAEMVKKQQIPVIGTSGASSCDYREQNFPSPMILLMGSERMGLLQKHLDICTSVVRIPMKGNCDSLNLSVATGIVLYEIFFQHQQGEK